MNTKQWAVLFVAMLSFDYATATYYFGNYKGVPKTYAQDDEGYYGWSRGCRCNEDLTYALDGALESIKGRLGRYRKGCQLNDHSLEEYEFKNGLVQGIHKFHRKGPYRCSLSRDYVRVIFIIEYVELLIHYTIYLVEDILTGFLGGIGSLIGKIFGKLTNYFFRCVIPHVYVTIVLHQNFGSDEAFVLEGLYLNNIENISFKDKKFKRHEDSLGPYCRPVFDHVLRTVFKDKLRPHFTKHFSQVTSEKEHFFYEKSESYEEDDDYRYDED